jgi:hypothetical protein
MKPYILLTLTLVFFLVGGDLLAQCPMCRATAESNLANGGTEGQGLNQGILYLLGMPYVLVATVAYIWWRNRRKEHEIA